MLKLKLQYFGRLMWRVDSLEKDSDAGRDWGQEEKGTTEDEMAGWHHWLDGREFEWTPGVGDGQGGLACRKESNTTEWLNWTELIFTMITVFLSFYAETYLISGEKLVSFFWQFVSMLSAFQRMYAQSCLFLCNPMDCSMPGCSVHRISRARILKWIAISPPEDLRSRD